MDNKTLIEEIKNIITEINLNVDLNQAEEIIIEQFQEKVDWGAISYKQGLSEQFIERFKNKINWSQISFHQKLSEQFIIKFQEKVCWEWISSNQKLSEQFIEKFQEKVCWEWISYHQKLSEEFIERLQKKVNWVGIVQNLNITITEKSLLNCYKNHYEIYNILKYKKGFEDYSKFIENKYKTLLIEFY